MPKHSYQLISKSELQLARIAGTSDSDRLIQMWSDSKFRIYLITSRGDKLLAHRLSIFDDRSKAIIYCFQQVSIFLELNSSVDNEELRKKLDFSPRRLEDSPDRIAFLCLISDVFIQTFKL